MKTKAIVIIIAIGILGTLGATGVNRRTAPALTRTSNSRASSFSAGNQTGKSGYKDGQFSGSEIDTPYGTVQVAAIIATGKITDVKFLQMPYDEGHSREVTAFSEPQLKTMALNNQSSHVDFVSGATDTSIGFEQSLQAALDQAAQ